jgi:hypothetical protein
MSEQQNSEEPTIEQATSAKERVAADALVAIVPGAILLLVAAIMAFYTNQQSGAMSPLSAVLGLIGIGVTGYGIYRLTNVKAIVDHKIECPFCQTVNHLTQVPKSDFRCDHCNREVPVEDGVVLRVYQVRCGYCNTLNYYSDKSTGLICESCDREIPIATDEETHAKKVFETYTIHDDDQPYDLTLVNAPKSDEMVACLQQMLALNRNQVKDMLEDLPQTLLTGIPKKKAELLKAQISIHKGKAESKVSGT